MWAYVLRKLLYNVPVYLGIILLMFALLRVNDPVYAYLGKNASQEQYDTLRTSMGLERPFVVQYASFVWDLCRFDLDERSWEQKRPVGEMLGRAIMPSLLVTIPALVLSTMISIAVGLVSAFYRGRLLDRTLVIGAVLGMSVSFLVYIIIGQYFGAFWLTERTGVDLFAVGGFNMDMVSPAWIVRNPIAAFNDWRYYCLLPILISVIVTMGYDTRFYRAVMVEETNRDYITTARAKGATRQRIMFVHMLKNAMIPIVTRVMITLPFLVTGSLLLEMYFNIPGMGRTLIGAIQAKDFPVIQAITALLAAVFILSNVLTDVLYAVVDPRVRLS